MVRAEEAESCSMLVHLLHVPRGLAQSCLSTGAHHCRTISYVAASFAQSLDGALVCTMIVWHMLHEAVSAYSSHNVARHCSRKLNVDN